MLFRTPVSVVQTSRTLFFVVAAVNLLGYTPKPPSNDIWYMIYGCIFGLQIYRRWSHKSGYGHHIHRVDNRKWSSSLQDRIKNYIGKKLEPGLRFPFPLIFNLGFYEAVPICRTSAVSENPTTFGLYEVRPYLYENESWYYREWINRLLCHIASTVSIYSLTSYPGRSLYYYYMY